MRRLAGLLCVIVGLYGQEPSEARFHFLGKELLYLYTEQEPTFKPFPLLVFLHSDVSGDLAAAKDFWKYWQPFAAGRGWSLVVPLTQEAGPAWTDAGVKALQAVVEDARKRLPVDDSRIYLGGHRDGASQVFYIASRLPDLWAAALAVEGNPKIAIDTNRVFGANTMWVPVLWALRPQEQDAMAPLHEKLISQGYNVAARASDKFTVKDAFDWLAKHTRKPFPQIIDCETGNAAFARCYWLEMTKFDPSLRNDVLGSSRVPPGAGAYLDLGGFGFNPSAPGPGIVVGWLPENYKGPLKLEDRILLLGGREIRDPRHYVEMMDQMKAEKVVGIIIERDGKRQRLETRVSLPKRGENITVRVQAQFLPELEELQVLSRGVSEMRIEVPVHWTPCRITWNASQVAKVEKAGCWLLTAGSPARPCGP